MKTAFAFVWLLVLQSDDSPIESASQKVVVLTCPLSFFFMLTSVQFVHVGLLTTGPASVWTMLHP